MENRLECFGLMTEFPLMSSKIRTSSVESAQTRKTKTDSNIEKLSRWVITCLG